jgi:hypothetical protein
VFFGGLHLAYASILQSDLNQNGISDSGESNVVMEISTTLPAGEYNFQNLTITNNATLTLDGDPDSVDVFKGVRINANNLTVNLGSSISANGRGYLTGPGSPDSSLWGTVGASYGGRGGGTSPQPIYDSATIPVNLGSGIEGRRGGGAIRLVISNTLQNDGTISADGIFDRTSGGNLYITTNHLVGSGVYSAIGGPTSWPYMNGSGGGGRIAIYFQDSSYGGTATARAGFLCFYGCARAAEDGTVGLFDTSDNSLKVVSSWSFQKNDEPFNFSHIILKNTSKTKSENNVSITAGDLLLDDHSSFALGEGQILNISEVNINDYSTLNLSVNKTLAIDSLNVTNYSTITVDPEKVLSLTVSNLNIDQTSFISADGKGYIDGPGTPPVYNEGGASYGGRGGGNSSPTYGSDITPTDFGSGTEGRRGGGAIRLIISGNLQNDGLISAQGDRERTSGGSIYVTTTNLSGLGTFNANGRDTVWPFGSVGAGGGGRIALYYQNQDYVPTATAKSGVYCYYGCAPAAEDGTVVMNSLGPVCSVDCFSNVLFLPGIMGSRLYEHNGLSDKELWVSRSDSNHADLALDSQGKSLVNGVYTKDDTQNNGEIDETGIVDDVYSANIYQSFIADLRKWKNDDKIIADYAFIPYDWRLSLDDIVTNGTTTNSNLSYNSSQNFSDSFILKKLESLQSNSRTGKVTIIAHSNGGLVAKALVQKLQDTNNPLYDKIDKIIFVGVPQVGTPDAIAALLHGNELGQGFIMSAGRSRQLAENMSAIYNFLPSAGYFSTVDPAFAVDKVVSFENKPFFNPQLAQYSFFVSNESELKNYVLGTDARIKPSFSDTTHPNIGNSSLYSKTESVHQVLDSWQPPLNTKVIQVAGWGEETLAGLDYEAIKDSNNVEQLSYKPRFVVDGDGTVVVSSALWMTALPNVERWWVDLPSYDTLTNLERVHKDILEVSNLRNFIKSQITDSSTFTDSENIVVNDTSTLVSNGVRLHYTLHSPLTLGVTDLQGRYTGQDPITKEIKEGVPGVNYRKIGDVQFISVPAGTFYTLKMKGYETGSFSLDVDKQIGNTVTDTTSFQGIPSSTTTIATMDIATNQEVASSTLKLDQNGDGTPEFNIMAKKDGIATMPYIFSGFLQPINDTAHQANQNLSVFKAGSTVPVKFQLYKYDGATMQAKTTPVWLTPQKGSQMSALVDETFYSVAGTSGNTYKWDATNQQYIYNWSTKGLASGYWYKIYAKLDDGNTYAVTIGLR